MLRHRASNTLFPYTTLFRSLPPPLPLPPLAGGRWEEGTPSRHAPRLPPPQPSPASGGDLESTRVNSSHEKIWSAVFSFAKKATAAVRSYYATRSTREARSAK